MDASLPDHGLYINGVVQEISIKGWKKKILEVEDLQSSGWQSGRRMSSSRISTSCVVVIRSYCSAPKPHFRSDVASVRPLRLCCCFRKSRDPMPARESSSETSQAEGTRLADG